MKQRWTEVKEESEKSTILVSNSFFLFLKFLGLYPWHMEVPRLGVEPELAAAGLHQSHRNARSKLCL